MDYFQTLERWFELQSILPALIEEERVLREGIFNGTFKKPTEGVNTLPLPDGRVLKGTYKINRKMDGELWKKHFKEIALPAETARELIVVKYDFKVGVYKKLPPELRKRFDRVLDIKPGLPTLELLPAKE